MATMTTLEKNVNQLSNKISTSEKKTRVLKDEKYEEKGDRKSVV